MKRVRTTSDTNSDSVDMPLSHTFSTIYRILTFHCVELIKKFLFFAIELSHDGVKVDDLLRLNCDEKAAKVLVHYHNITAGTRDTTPHVSIEETGYKRSMEESIQSITARITSLTASPSFRQSKISCRSCSIFFLFFLLLQHTVTQNATIAAITAVMPAAI